MLLLLLASSLAQTQMDYASCLSAEMDAAIRRGATADVFAQVVSQLCEDETRAYRAAAIASLVEVERSRPGFDAQAADTGAGARFDQVDATNRAGMVRSFTTRLRMRRGAASPAAPRAAPASAPGADDAR